MICRDLSFSNRISKNQIKSEIKSQCFESNLYSSNLQMFWNSDLNPNRDLPIITHYMTHWVPQQILMQHSFTLTSDHDLWPSTSAGELWLHSSLIHMQKLTFKMAAVRSLGFLDIQNFASKPSDPLCITIQNVTDRSNQCNFFCFFFKTGWSIHKLLD